MVKLNFWEEFAIYVLVFIGTVFIPVDTENWIVAVLLIIIWLGVSSIIVKLIKGKDAIKKEEKERVIKERERSENFSNWWNRQKTWEKVIIILGFIIILIMLLGFIFPNLFS